MGNVYNTGDTLVKANGPRFAQFKKTSGDTAIPAADTNWQNLDTGTDLTLTSVSAGDTVLVGMSGMYNTENVVGFIDVCSVVSAAPVNYWGSGEQSQTGQGISAIQRRLVNNLENFSCIVPKVIVSGDLSAGQLTVRIRSRLNSASALTLLSDTTIPFHFFAYNIG